MSVNSTNCNQLVRSIAELGDDFPSRLVKYMASKPCGCQWNAPMLERNVHWPSCWIGQAQEYLGRRVTWECNGKPAKSPNAKSSDLRDKPVSLEFLTVKFITQ